MWAALFSVQLYSHKSVGQINSPKGWLRDAIEEMKFQTRPGDSHRRCGGDVIDQTVPDTNSSNRLVQLCCRFCAKEIKFGWQYYYFEFLSEDKLESSWDTVEIRRRLNEVCSKARKFFIFIKLLTHSFFHNKLQQCTMISYDLCTVIILPCEIDNLVTSDCLVKTLWINANDRVAANNTFAGRNCWPIIYDFQSSACGSCSLNKAHSVTRSGINVRAQRGSATHLAKYVIIASWNSTCRAAGRIENVL